MYIYTPSSTQVNIILYYITYITRYDIIWHYMILYDIIWYYMTLYDIYYITYTYITYTYTYVT